MNLKTFNKYRIEVAILTLFVILTIIFYYFSPIIHCYLIFGTISESEVCTTNKLGEAREIKIFNIFWDIIPITIFSLFLTFVFLKKKAVPFFIIIIILCIFSYGIPLSENKLLWGIEDTWVYFKHARSVYENKAFLFDPNDLINKTPDYTPPLFNAISATFSMITGIDVIYSWIFLCFISALASSLFIYLITKMLTKDSMISFLSSILAFSISYRTLAWTHPEVFGTTMVLGSLFFILKYILFKEDFKYLILCGLFIACAILSHLIPGIFACVLVFFISIYHIIRKRGVKIFIPLILGLILTLPYYYQLLTETSFLSGTGMESRNKQIGENWVPFMCTDLRYCSPIFSGLAITFLLIFFFLAYQHRKKENYILILLMVLSSSFLLYHVLFYRWGLFPFVMKSNRFSSLTFIIYSVAAVFVLKDLKKPVKIFFIFLFIFFGLYYSYYEGKDASWSIKTSSEDFKFFTWIRENIGKDARFLIYNQRSYDISKFYDIAGRNYILPSTKGPNEVEGQFWESGFIGLSKNYEYVKNRVNEWLELNKTNNSDLVLFFSKYNVTHVLYFGDENTEEFKSLNEICTSLKTEANIHLFRCLVY